VATGKLQFSGTEYHGAPYPLIGYTLRLPGGTTLSNAGFPTCSSAVLKNSGPAACPTGSHAGPMTSFLMILTFGAERVPEEGTVQAFFSPEGGVLLYFEAHSPVFLEFIVAGNDEPAAPPLGPAVRFKLPLVETVPGAPYASFTDLAVALGAFRTEAGHEIASVVAPGECPKGSFSWPARSLFTDGEGHETTVLSEYFTPCLPAGKRTGTSTTLMASKGTLVAGEADTYTATVTPKTGGGETPTGTVSFYNNGAPIPGCTAISLTANGASATAGCNATPEEGTQAVTATYSGDLSYTQSEALAITVTVTSRSTAEEEAAKKKAEEEAKKKHEEEAAATAAKIPSSGVLGSQAAALPAPKLAVTGNLAPVSGSVLVKLPGSSTFVSLTTVHQIPFGTVVNATHGRVSVTTAGPHGGTQMAEFFEGEFVLTQGRNGLVVATLTGGNFAVCPTARERSHVARASSSHASSKHVVRKLWANAHGSFSIKGNYAAGAVQGTEWLTEDLCDGTLIRVTRDRVLVTNLVNHRHVTVKAGHRYLAKAP
jgi:hypothetical protein